ncbi:hypothetical protein JCGZ_24136 [Jatropha curcas]|uniref:Uncharacterized protein n=1 Tax=Jatropha curcas TaxID=180498 RepID=A0A067L8Y0_JATCU|nr:hypothetical protein JCGZ_24136 [Jatropha curcas]
MAYAKINFELVFFFLFHLLFLPSIFVASPLKENQYICAFDAIFQLGDSTSDTGNLIQEDPSSSCVRFPYGETFFKKPTGRCSDGLLIIDYIARSAGVPFLDAYLTPNVTFSHGANFAVSGSTALPVSVLAEKKIIAPITNSSLSVQLDWMFSYFKGRCRNGEGDSTSDTGNLIQEDPSSSCVRFPYGETFFKKPTGRCSDGLLIIDYIARSAGVPFLDAYLTPNVTFSHGANFAVSGSTALPKIIDYGGRRVVVPGHFPNGCLPIYLTRFKTNDTTAYDEFQCLKELNNLSIYHNQLLQQTIEGLKKEYSNVSIEYGDYYSAYQWILRHASSLGFDVKSLQKACCGVGGDYNFDLQRMCGASDVTVCAEPQKYVNWDGVHFTEEAYKHIATLLIHEMNIKGQCNSY